MERLLTRTWRGASLVTRAVLLVAMLWSVYRNAGPLGLAVALLLPLVVLAVVWAVSARLRRAPLR